MPQIANYKDFSNLNKLKNDNNLNHNFNSLPENLHRLPKDFLFPSQNSFNHKHMLASNPLMQQPLMKETIYEKIEKRNLKALVEQEALEVGDFLVKTQEKTEEKKPAKPQTLKDTVEEEKTTDLKKETLTNLQNQKEQPLLKSKSFIFKPASELQKEDENKKEQIKDETFNNAEMAFNPKEDEKFKMELKKQETQGEKHNLQQQADAKAAERQVIEFLNAQKFSKEENKKAQEKAKKEAKDLLEKVGKERKRVNRKKKGGQSNTSKNSAAEENKTNLNKLIYNLINAKKSNLFILMLLAAFVLVSILVFYNLF
jgi:hypothetical protein